METQEQTLCACCMNSFQQSDLFCNDCGYPLQGTKNEQDNYIANRAVKEIDLVELDSKVKRACNSLYWIAIILGVSGLFFTFTVEGDAIVPFVITFSILIAAFLAFGVWSKTKPVAALISGLALYSVIILIDAIDNPASIFSGIIIKIFIIGYLIKGIIAVLEVEKIKKELNIK